MLISLCIPCHNRAHDLKFTMPYLINAANASPPVEIAILDYNSPDDLREYIDAVYRFPLGNGVSLNYRKYTGRDYYHIAHAYNLAVLASHGEYFVLLGADAYPEPSYIQFVRQLISQGCIWMHANELHGIFACQRKEFIDAGGYDERFEHYGGEDRELDARLVRRGGKFGLIPKGLMHVVYTPDEYKTSNYRLKLSKHQMSRMNRPYIEESARNGTLVANADRAWGEFG